MKLINEISEASKMGFESLRANKMRSILAMLGVIIGISFVIIMGWILSGLDSSLEATINLMGNDMLYVDKWEWFGNHKNWREMFNRKNVTLQQAEALAKRITTAELAYVSARTWQGNAQYRDNKLSQIAIIGTQYKMAFTSSATLSSGRFFSQTEDELGSNVVVVGYNIGDKLFPNENPVGKEIKLNGYPFTIIGLIEKKGTLLTDFIDNQVYVPVQSFVGKFGVSRRSISIGLKAGSEANMSNVREEARGLMREIRNLKPGEDDDFAINESASFKENIATLRGSIWGVGIGLTTLSFLVGIIGIMNIMFVSVAERTKEIGIRKAIGAPSRSILFQFLFESATLCLAGAAISFVLCSTLIFATATILPKLIPSMSFLSKFISLDLLIIASVVSIVVGALSGIIPARRAAKLDPVDALRSE